MQPKSQFLLTKSFNEILPVVIGHSWILILLIFDIWNFFKGSVRIIFIFNARFDICIFGNLVQLLVNNLQSELDILTILVLFWLQVVKFRQIIDGNSDEPVLAVKWSFGLVLSWQCIMWDSRVHFEWWRSFKLEFKIALNRINCSSMTNKSTFLRAFQISSFFDHSVSTVSDRFVSNLFVT